LGKLRPLSGRQVIGILADQGFVEARRRGSHIVMQKVVSGRTVTVVFPSHREIRRGTLASIIRQSRLSRALFEG
jgi:predicted RNA binding protein YcfA (HicA-like mRNA interferase family)